MAAEQTSVLHPQRSYKNMDGTTCQIWVVQAELSYRGEWWANSTDPRAPDSLYIQEFGVGQQDRCMYCRLSYHVGMKGGTTGQI